MKLRMHVKEITPGSAWGIDSIEQDRFIDTLLFAVSCIIGFTSESGILKKIQTYNNFEVTNMHRVTVWPQVIGPQEGRREIE